MSDKKTDSSAHINRSNFLGAVLKFIVPVAISVGLCWLLFHDDSLSDMLAVIQTKCDFKWIGIMLVVEIFSFVFRALRWGLQLEGVGVKAPLSELVYSIFGTYAVNLVVPRLGEFWRSGFIAHREDAQFGTVFGTMLADRFADLITGMTFMLLTLLVGHQAIASFVTQYPEGYEKLADFATSPWTILAVLVVVVGAVVFFRSKSSNGLVNKLRSFCEDLWHGFAAVVKIKRKGMWLLWTLLLWGCYFGQMVLAFQAFPFTRDILADHGLVAVLVCFTLGTMAMGIPSNGGIGPYQIAIIFGLCLYCPPGLDEAARKAFELDSKAFANLVLSMSTFLTIVLGLWAFVAIALSRKRPRRAE